MSARCVDVAAADLVAHVAQVLERLDDHVAHDDVRGDHRQEDGDDGRGQQDGPVHVQVLLRRPVGNADLDDADQVAQAIGGGGGTGSAIALDRELMSQPGPRDCGR